MNYKIDSMRKMADLVYEIGYLPFFKNEIAGFSIEEMCEPALWFAKDIDGPWEWKGPIINEGKCIYGKFFGGKAVFISKNKFPEFANYRRDGYDFDSRVDDGLVYYKDKELFEAIAEDAPILSKDLKIKLDYTKGGKKGFDTVITRLQMQTYVCVADFVYMRDRHGKKYGWGVAEYTTPEAIFGYDYIASAYKRDPLESKQAVIDDMKKLFPYENDSTIEKLIK